MTERTIETVQLELAAAERGIEEMGREIKRLREERDALLLAAASHPWLGKQVERTIMRGYRPNLKATTQRGTVVAYNPYDHRRLRSLSYFTLNAGDPIVVHKGGLTGWKLLETWGENKGQPDGWTLVEEKAK